MKPRLEYYEYLHVPAAKRAPLWAGLIGLAAVAGAIMLGFAISQGWLEPMQSIVFGMLVLGGVFAAILVYRSVKNYGAAMSHEGLFVTEPKEKNYPWPRIKAVHPGERKLIGGRSVWLELQDGRTQDISGTRWASTITRESVVALIEARRQEAARAERRRRSDSHD